MMETGTLEVLGPASLLWWGLDLFSISLTLSILLILLGALRQVREKGPGHGQHELYRLRKRSFSIGLLPVIVWAWELNHLSRLVESTHTWANPAGLLASMQLALIGVAVLPLVAGSSFIGMGWLTKERPAAGTVALGFVIIAGSLADWMLSEVGWWKLIVK